MKRLLREPLLHFLLLGVAIFIAYGLVSAPGSDAPATIVVTRGRVEHLGAGFAMLWGRPPTDAELEGLVDEWVREEIATREALALALDKDDTVIRRRLRQKLEFLSDDTVALTAPTDAELNAYLQAHPGSFLVEPRLTFRQVYLDPKQHDARDSALLLAQLTQHEADASTLGDSTLLPRALDDVPSSDIAKQFGESFAATVKGLPLGRWQGPVESVYGVHLVLVSERTEAHLPELSDVRSAVQSEWANARRLEAKENFYRELLERYTVTFEGPVEGSEETGRDQVTLASLFIALLMVLAPGAMAHEVRPAYLELRQTESETYEALWKVPGLGDDMRLGLYVELPGGCTTVSEPRPSMVHGAYSERWTTRCAGGLTGGTIRIAGLSGTMTDVLVRVERLDGTAQMARLTPSAAAFVVEAVPRALEVARTYAVMGVEHILTGIDHLLFVLALLIITRGGWKMVKTVTAFTASHSLTLGAATLGFVQVPQQPVEAVIALSIVFVAAEIVRMHRGVDSITARAPWLVAFTFGLMHGLGFAGGLSDAGLPAGHVPTALLFFSVGVETGHVLFVGVVLSVIALVHRVHIRVPAWSELVPPYAIGAVAMFWVIQRTVSFLT